jgi:hypothetical protein
MDGRAGAAMDGFTAIPKPRKADETAYCRPILAAIEITR